MSEFREGKDPVLWRMLEGLLISVLIVVAFIVAIAEVVWSVITHWWKGK